MSTFNKGKPNLKILIPLILLILISILVYVFLIKNKEVKSPTETHQQRTSDIKEDLITLIPEQYEVIESEYEQPSTENYGCISLYEIYPKEYTDMEKEYLDSGYIKYCKDINTASIGSQIGKVRYDSKEDSWFYIDGDSRILQEKKTFGTNIVTISSAWGSHHSDAVYIVKVNYSNEVIMLFIPEATRIRCEKYDENGVESWEEECVEFLNSINIYSAGNGWVFDEKYEEYYNDLLEILIDI